MKSRRRVTRTAAALALLIALAADGAQLFLNTPLALLFGVGVEVVDAAIDALACALIIGLLGFHWILLPAFVIELVPLVDDIPTWTGCVAFVIWKRGKLSDVGALPPFQS
jgi:hypothetical protein